MPLKMIVTDLDDTLLHGDKSISDYTASILNRCKKNGIKVAFATGRSEHATRRFQEKIIPDYIISNNGATINHGEKVIHSLLIPQSMMNELVTLFLSSKEISSISVEVGCSTFTNYDGPLWEPGWNIVHTTLFDEINTDVSKLSVECKNRNFLMEVLQVYPDLHFYSSSGEPWHQIMCKKSTKANAIIYISELLDFAFKDIVAFGDDYNDIDMLQNCGISVAVSNAINDVKAVADSICDSNDNDGVAKWIEENLL